MSPSFTPCIPCNWFYTCAQSVLTYFFFFPDEDAKAESCSEDKRPDVLQAQTQDRPQQQSSQPETSSGSSQLSGCGSLRKPEQPDLADRSSQSSFTSQDGTGKHERRCSKSTHDNTNFGMSSIKLHLNCLSGPYLNDLKCTV